MKKRALTLLLALVMCLSLCTPVMAEEVRQKERLFTRLQRRKEMPFLKRKWKKLSQLFPMVLQEKLGINIRVRI